MKSELNLARQFAFNYGLIPSSESHCNAAANLYTVHPEWLPRGVEFWSLRRGTCSLEEKKHPLPCQFQIRVSENRSDEQLHNQHVSIYNVCMRRAYKNNICGC